MLVRYANMEGKKPRRSLAIIRQTLFEPRVLEMCKWLNSQYLFAQRILPEQSDCLFLTVRAV
jgi:hypothetical protein